MGQQLQLLQSRIEAFAAIHKDRFARPREIAAWVKGQSVGPLVLRFPFLVVFSRVKPFRQPIQRIQEIQRDPMAQSCRLNEDFVEDELEQFAELFKLVEKKPLTRMQQIACVINSDNNLIVAAAGSGKTSVLVGRVAYLIRSGLAKPEDILLLAFGNKAAAEIGQRMQARLKPAEQAASATFHGIGLTILAEVRGEKPSISKLAEDDEARQRKLAQIIRHLAGSRLVFSEKLARYIALHQTPFIPQYMFKELADKILHFKKHEIRTLKGELVKSQEEVAIANYLAIHGVAYEYEKDYEFKTATKEFSQYRPDFYLPDAKVYIEHFGVDEKGRTAPFVDQKKYQEGMVWKRQLHSEQGTKMVETYSYQFKGDQVFKELRSKLEAHGVVFGQADLELGQEGERKKGRTLERVACKFLDVYKSSALSPAELRRRAKNHEAPERARAFLDLFEPILETYNSELHKTGEIDFADMIIQAAEAVEQGRYRPKFKHILVDEFQDISPARARLLKALRDAVEGSTLFCVGDDWQSIYRFSGADLTLMTGFERNFGFRAEVNLDMTFRYNNKLGKFSGNFVTRNPAQLKKYVRSWDQVDDSAVTLLQHPKSAADEALGRCLEAIASDVKLSEKKRASVFLIGRYRHVCPQNLKALQRRYSQLDLEFVTAHSSKGKEADYVIVLQVDDGRLGFPSQIEDEPLLQLVLPEADDFPHAEERRLFYVAVTRARHHTFILSDVQAPSVFVKEMLEHRSTRYEFKNDTDAQTQMLVEFEPPCPVCREGHLVRKPGKFGKDFFGCSNYPYCENTARLCENCQTHPMFRSGMQYRCSGSDCGHVERICPRCLEGRLILRNGKNGKFWGCSRFANGGCRHTEAVAKAAVKVVN